MATSLHPSSANPTQSRVDDHLAWIGQRGSRPQAPTPSKTALVVPDQQLLPLWESPQRGVPNGFMRSGLFRARDDSPSRGFERDVPVASLANYEIRFSGVPLVQDDLTVLISLLSLARGQNLDQQVSFTGYALVRAMGWSVNARSYDKLRGSISNLKLAVISIRERVSDGSTRRYDGNIIRDFACVNRAEGDSGQTEAWWVRFEPTIADLFDPDRTTLLEWQVRLRLGSRRPVATFLHGFYSSHRDPLPISISKLYELANSGSSLSVFRRSVRNALDVLVRYSFLESFAIENDIVSVTRAKSRLAA